LGDSQLELKWLYTPNPEVTLTKILKG